MVIRNHQAGSRQLAGLGLFPERRGQHVSAERETGDQPFQLPILLFQLPEPVEFVHVQLSRDIIDGTVLFRLAVGGQDLLLGEL